MYKFILFAMFLQAFAFACTEDLRITKRYDPLQLHCSTSSSDLLCDTTSVTVSWFKDGALLSGENSATLTLNNPELSDEGVYKCSVSDVFSPNENVLGKTKKRHAATCLTLC